jgi:hypothetical protein
MLRAGIKGIWNFTPTKLQLPDGVVSQKEDLAEGLAVLSHRLHHLPTAAAAFPGVESDAKFSRRAGRPA